MKAEAKVLARDLLGFADETRKRIWAGRGDGGVRSTSEGPKEGMSRSGPIGAVHLQDQS